jgi:hypothetical protein
VTGEAVAVVSACTVVGAALGAGYGALTFDPEA